MVFRDYRALQLRVLILSLVNWLAVKELEAKLHDMPI